MEIRDHWTAREFDNEAANYIQNEIVKREFERERRDREFWAALSPFGGGDDGEPDVEIVGEVGIAQLGQR